MQPPSTSLDAVRPAILGILDQAQRSANTHRKNVAVLYKLFRRCLAVTEQLADGRGKTSTRLVGEKQFLDVVLLEGVNRILPVKRGVLNADRCIKFVCTFVVHASTHSDVEQDPGPASRLTSHLIKHLLKGFNAKDKNVRFRSTQFIATLLSGLGELDSGDYELMYSALLARASDKEASIRVQAALGLGKLANPDQLSPENEEHFRERVEAILSGEQDDGDEDEQTPTEKLIELMSTDPSAEVRRAALFQIELHPLTLPYILERVRDVDPLTRRSLYTSALAELPSILALTPHQRGTVVKTGLRDREEAVAGAAAKLLGKWAEVQGGIEEFALAFDVLNDTEVAEAALTSVIATRSDLAGAFQFDEVYWTELTPVSALIANLYIAYCKSANDEMRLEACLPVVTALAFRIQDQHSRLTALGDDLATVTGNEADKDLADQLNEEFQKTAFITNQLLAIAMMADYGDEIGRRKMFTLIRDMLSDPMLPSILIGGCMDVLSKLSTGERDFMRVVVEIVQNVREDANAVRSSQEPENDDAEEEEEQEDEEDELDLNTATVEQIQADQRKRLEKAAKKIRNRGLDMTKVETYLRCLAIVHALLARVTGALQDNPTLRGVVNELIVPAVNTKDLELRSQGLMCLGLCCLLDKDMALDSFGLFVHQAQSATGDLQMNTFKIIFDIIMLHGPALLEVKGYGLREVVDFLMHALNHQTPEIQAVTTVCICKLMLSGMVVDEDIAEAVLEQLTLVYFAPETIDNLELRQCLSYFLPVYCYSTSTNQRRMQKRVLSIFGILADVYNSESQDKTVLISPPQLFNQLLDWTDPNKVVTIEGLPVDEQVHVDLGIQLLQAIYEDGSRETRKMFCQTLSKLYLPDNADEWKLKNMHFLIIQLDMHRPLHDTVSRNALKRFETSLQKRFGEQMQPMDEADFRALDQAQATTQFIDKIIEENHEREDEDGSSAVPLKKSTGKKIPASRKRGASVRASKSTSVDPDESILSTATARRSGRKSKAVVQPAQPIFEESDEEALQDDEESESDASSNHPPTEASTDDTL